MLSTHKIILYKNHKGEEPFSLWIESLDRSVRTRIKARLNRLECGNLGEWRRIGQGLFEIRVHFGAGYRIYFSLRRDAIILLLCAGDKASQEKDIALAQKYLQDLIRVVR